MKKKSDSLSGFTCLVLTALSCIVSVFTRNYYTHALFMVWLLIVLSYFGFLKQGMLYLMLYVFTTVWLTQAVPKGIMIISPMLLSMMYTFILPVSAAYLTFHIPSGKLIAVFQKMRIPKNILLVLIIIVRFIPTISDEVRGIKEAMKVRGYRFCPYGAAASVPHYGIRRCPAHFSFYKNRRRTCSGSDCARY